MSEWRLIWLVRIKYAKLADNGGYPYRDVPAETVAELRRIIEWARASPKIVGFPYRRVRERYGPEPHTCRHGHPYDGPSAIRAFYDWAECPCGGHYVIVCRRTGCDDVQIDPPTYHDCTASDATLAATARQRRKNRH